MKLSSWPSSIQHREYLVQNISVVDIETSTACNRKCSYCPNSTYDNASIANSSFMSKEVFTKIVWDLWNEGYQWEICLQRYNEPLMDDRIVDLVAMASKLAPKATITIYSNGDYLTVELYKELLAAWLGKLTITQHWSRPAKWLVEVLSYRKNNPDKIVFKYKELSQPLKFYNRWWEVQLETNQTQNFFCKTLDCVTINSKGEIILCCNDYHSSHVFWNAGEQNVIDIYLWTKFQSVRVEAITWFFSREICNRCMYGAK